MIREKNCGICKYAPCGMYDEPCRSCFDARIKQGKRYSKFKIAKFVDALYAEMTEGRRTHGTKP